MTKKPNSGVIFGQILLWICLSSELLWLIVAFRLAPAPYPYQLWLLLIFRIFVGVSVISFRRTPLLASFAAGINLVGSVLVTNRPIGVAHSWLWFIYYHSIELLILIATLAIWRLQLKAITTTV